MPARDAKPFYDLGRGFHHRHDLHEQLIERPGDIRAFLAAGPVGGYKSIVSAD
jgi:hypothetical protein